MNIRCLFLIGLILSTQLSTAQVQNSTWLMGNKLGIRFSATNRSIVSSENLPMNATLGSSSYTDTSNGRLILYTDGSNVYSGNHTRMPNGTRINGDSLSSHSVIVQDAYKRSKFYIISSGTTNSTIYYSIVDMNARGGQGDVTSKQNVLSTNSDLQFCIVKRYYDMGYWIVTHKSGSNQFYCFSIDSAGVNLNPVVSLAGSNSPPKGIYIYGEMVSNVQGDEITFTHGQANKDAIAERFKIDKKCGIITPISSFLGAGIDVLGGIAFAAYSPDDTKLYVNWLNAVGENILIQYDISSDPVTSFVVFQDNSRFDSKNTDIQLAPDGRIYLSVEVTSFLSLVQSPNSAGAACGYLHRGIDLQISSMQPNSYSLKYLPQFMMNVASQPKPFVKPIIQLEDGCEGDTTMFSVQDEFSADSFLWNLGDGTTSKLPKPKHKYLNEGDYLVTFIWHSCNMRYQVIDTVKIRKASVVSLGNDTILCYSKQIILKGPIGAESYLWSTGDTSTNISVDKEGNYRLTVTSGDCINQDEVKISFYNQLWTALGDEYLICEDDQEVVKLDAGEQFAQYKWIPTGDTTQWIIVGNVGEYFVVVKDYRGCDGSDGTKVKRRCSVYAYFPNVFTPNGDGVNDVFAPKGKDIEQLEIWIANRWGEVIWKSNSLTAQWDGTIDGKLAPDGAYAYKAIYKGFVNKRLQTFTTEGTVTLLR